MDGKLRLLIGDHVNTVVNPQPIHCIWLVNVPARITDNQMHVS